MSNLGFSEDKLMQHYLILPNLGNVLACLTAIADYDLTGIQLFTDYLHTYCTKVFCPRSGLWYSVHIGIWIMLEWDEKSLHALGFETVITRQGNHCLIHWSMAIPFYLLQNVSYILSHFKQSNWNICIKISYRKKVYSKASINAVFLCQRKSALFKNAVGCPAWAHSTNRAARKDASLKWQF